MKLEYCLNSLVLKQINKDKGRVYKECITNRCKDTVKALYKCIKKNKAKFNFSKTFNFI